MIPAKNFWKELKHRDFHFFSGVPCSFLTETLDAIPDEQDITYVPAVREDIALGIASGAYFAGKRSAIFIQNSGLGNIVNPLTTFNLMYQVPVLLVITWRGYQGKDAPEHNVTGEKMEGFLSVMGIPYSVLDKDNLSSCLDEATGYMDACKKPYAIILKKGVIK